MLSGALCLLSCNLVFAWKNIYKITKYDNLTVKDIPEDISAPVRPRTIAVVINDETIRYVGESDLQHSLRVQAGYILEGHLNQFLYDSGFTVIEIEQLQKKLMGQWRKLSGSANNAEVSQIGKMADITDFVFTKITSIDIKEDPPTETKRTMQDQWLYFMTVGIDIRIVNVESAQTMATISETKTRSNATYSKSEVEAENLMYKAIASVVDDSVPALQKALPLRGYVTAMRKKRRYALINLGRKHGVKEKSKFGVYEMGTILDETGKEISGKKLINTLKVFQVDEDTSWAKVSNNNRLLIGQIVENIPDKRSFGHKLLRGLKETGKN